MRDGRSGHGKKDVPSRVAAECESPARKYREQWGNLGMSPVGTAPSTASPEDKLRVIGNVTFAQQGNELILERMRCMVFALMFDVMSYRIAVRGANTECSISFLPRKIKSMLTEPPGRVGLKNLNCLCQWHGGRQRNQQVGVIRGTSSTKHRDVLALADSHEIHAQFFVQLIRDGILPIFRGEDAMDEDVWISMGHSVPPLRGSLAFPLSLPALPCRAFTFRA